MKRRIGGSGWIVLAGAGAGGPGAGGPAARRSRRSSAGRSTPSARARTTRTNIRTIVLELRHGRRLPARPGQRRPERLPLGRGAQGQRDELQRRHHAVRAGECPGPQRRHLYIMETGFRERQGISPRYNRIMRFEPRPGLLPGDPGDQRRRARRPSATTRAPGRDRGRTALADPDDPGWAGQLERLLRQAAGRRPGELHGHGRRLLRRLGLQPRQPRLDAPRARPARRGARLPVGEPAGRQRHLLALRHHQRGHDRLRRQHHLRPLHGLRGRRLGALLRRHLRVGRRQRLLRPLLRASTWSTPGTTTGTAWTCPATAARPATSATPTWRRPGNPYDGSTTTRTASPTRRRDGGPGTRIDGPGRRSAPTSSRTTTWRSSRPTYGPLEEPPGLPRRRLVDRRRGHGLDRRVPRRRAPTASPTPATPARATASRPRASRTSTAPT